MQDEVEISDHCWREFVLWCTDATPQACIEPVSIVDMHSKRRVSAGRRASEIFLPDFLSDNIEAQDDACAEALGVVSMTSTPCMRETQYVPGVSPVCWLRFGLTYSRHWLMCSIQTTGRSESQGDDIRRAIASCEVCTVERAPPYQS